MFEPKPKELTELEKLNALSPGTPAQFTGSENWYRHSLNRRLLYTDGVKYVADTAGAYWLIDIIASVQHLPRVAKEEHQTWTLTVDGSKGVVVATDGNRRKLYTQKIEYTDFPLPELTLYAVGNSTERTVLLQSEY
jgi:hypothetical protein